VVSSFEGKVDAATTRRKAAKNFHKQKENFPAVTIMKLTSISNPFNCIPFLAQLRLAIILYISISKIIFQPHSLSVSQSVSRAGVLSRSVSRLGQTI